ncbi:hypothetical protein, partial [Coralloluteibacterium thermophilus]
VAWQTSPQGSRMSLTGPENFAERRGQWAEVKRVRKLGCHACKNAVRGWGLVACGLEPQRKHPACIASGHYTYDKRAAA